MKKILVLISIIAFATSCTLEEKILSSSTPDTYYKTVVQCRTGLNGCYLPLEAMYRSGDYFEVCEAASDLIYHSYSSYYDAQCDYNPTRPRYGSTIWVQSYKGVMRCNAIYQAILRSPLTDEEQAPLLAECAILRAYYYYILTINFGDVPYYFDEVTDANNDIITQLPRMSATELRNILIEELWYWLADKTQVTADGRQCQQALPYIKTYDPLNEYRIGSMVGCVIGGKLSMWNKDWDRAIGFYKYIEDVYRKVDDDAIENDGSTSSEEGESGDDEYIIKNCLLGYKLSDIKFRNRYTEESIFELPGHAKDYGLRVTHGIASRCTPPRSTASPGQEDETDETEENLDETVDLSKKSDMYNGVRIPEFGSEMRTTHAYRPTRYFYRSSSYDDGWGEKVSKGLMAYNSTDKRRATYDPANYSQDEITEIEDGGGFLAWCWAGWTSTENINTVPRHMQWFSSPGSATGRPFLGDKFWCPGMVYTQDSNNLKIFRFANVVLDLAEAHMRMGNFRLANAYLNAPKRRAGIAEVNYTDEDSFMEELMKESARELFGEFTRRHNLVRWGKWSEHVSRYSDSSSLRTRAKNYPCLQYYPIPDEQVVLSNYNLDNKEYDKYGL